VLRISLLFLVVVNLNLFPAITLQAKNLVIDSLIIVGIEQSINQNYAQAESTFYRIIQIDENHPCGYFYLAASLQSKMMDYETDLWEELFFSNISQAEKLSQQLINQNKNNIEAYFYWGSARSYRAFYDGKKKKYLSAIQHGMSGIFALKKVIELDTTFYDAYFGIGSYKYWRSKLTRYLNWLPLIHDDREEGIRLVKLAAEKGKFTNHAATNELVWILIDCGQVSEALSWAKTGLTRYPQSRFFLWGTAKSYFMLQNYEAALIYYNKILTSIQQEFLNNHYNEVICYFKISQCHYYQKDYEQARIAVNRIYDIQLSPQIAKRLEDILNKANDLKQKIESEKKHKLNEKVH